MARHKEHDAQVDPFTAGEPTLPWDEPGTFGGLFGGMEPEACVFDGSPYDGPTKKRDDYNAPSADVDDEGPRRGQRRSPSEARERKRQARAERDAARRAAKAAPKDKQGPSRLVKVARTIILVVILVNLLPALIYGASELFSALTSGEDFTEVVESETSSHDGSAPGPGIDMDSLDEDELACVQACNAYLQAVTSEQSPERAAIIDDFDQSMVEASGYTCEELGIDANAYADWVLSNFSYQIDSCYPRADEGTASLYLYAWGPDLIDMRAELHQSIYTYIAELDAGRTGSMRPLDESEQEHVRKLFAEAVENTELGSESFLGFQLTFEGGAWVLDIEQAQYQLDIPLGF